MVELEGGMNLLNSLIFEEQEMYDANKIDFDRHWKEIIAGMPDSFLLLLERNFLNKLTLRQSYNRWSKNYFQFIQSKG